MQSASAAGGGRGRGPGSFPLSEELLDIETWDIALLSSADGLPEEFSSVPRAAPGHHRATMLLDGISCSSSGGSSARSTPAGSFDGTSAQHAAGSVASSTASGQPLMPAGAGVVSLNVSTADLSGVIDSTLQSSSCGNLSTATLSALTAPAAISTEQQSPAGTMPAQPSQSCPAEASISRSSAGHAAPSTLQLPDFSAFMLPEECTFTESSMDDALMTPTPHTPIVPNMFAGDGLPAVAARTCRPHYTSSGNGSANSSSSGSSSLSGGSNGGAGCYLEPGAAAAAEGDSGNSVQQLGTCRALLIDNGDDEFELDPFPAAIVPSPSSSRNHTGGGGWQTYAGLEMLQNGSWESSQGFTSILCRRTLSTVSEATHEGIDSESPSSTPSAAQTGASPEHHQHQASPQHQQQQQPVEDLSQQQDHQNPQRQQQQQQQHQDGQVSLTVTVSGSGSIPEAHQQWCDPVGQKELPHGLPPAASPPCSSSNSSSIEGACAAPAAAQQASLQEGAVQAAAAFLDAAAEADSAGVVLELCSDADFSASLEQQQQQQQVVAANQCAAAATSTDAAAADGAAQQLHSGAEAAEQLQRQQTAGAAASEHAPACVPATADKVGSGSGSGARVIEVTADATAAATTTTAVAVVEDVWEAANKQRLQQQLLMQQEQQQAQALTHPALEAQLLTAGSSSSSSSSPGQRQQQCHLRQPPLLQRLLLCGCNSGSAAGQQQQQQCQQVLQLAKTPFCNDSSLHLALLQAVHSAYTGKPGPVPRLGPHWAALGFQGDDPATDLRGAGVLGLLQLLYLHWHDAAAADRIVKLAQSPQQEFPMAIVSINVTAWTLGALRSGQLDRAAQQLGGHMAAANSFYCGVMYEFYSRWLRGKKTMLDSGIVLKQLERYCSGHCKQMLKLAENRKLPLQ